MPEKQMQIVNTISEHYRIWPNYRTCSYKRTGKLFSSL